MSTNLVVDTSIQLRSPDFKVTSADAYPPAALTPGCAAACLIGLHRLLGDTQRLGQLGLGQVALLAQRGDAFAHGNKERALVAADGHGG
jgi:hypothetical protein